MGIVDVGITVGGSVLVGNGVCVGKFVRGICVKVGEIAKVGVSVTGTLDGKLQASIAKTNITAGNKVRAFIASPFL